VNELLAGDSTVKVSNPERASRGLDLRGRPSDLGDTERLVDVGATK
jgi:hypothetical protein